MLRHAHNLEMAVTPRPVRSIRLVRPPTIDGIGVLRLSVRQTIGFYTFREIPCEIGGRGFAVHRLGLGELYHVRIGRPEDCGCECLGFLRHGRCKHIQGLLALEAQGLL
jgi:hypothetical protein